MQSAKKTQTPRPPGPDTHTTRPSPYLISSHLTISIMFPPKPPPPQDIINDISKLKSLDPRISFDNHNKQFLFTHENNEYQYSFIVDKWIPIAKRVLDDDELEEEANRQEIKQLKRQKLLDIKKQKQQPKQNKSVFISNLPQISPTVLQQYFEKYGAIAVDKGNSPRVKLYYENDKFKGEALIIYENASSVDLAIQMMNKTQISNNTITVEEATFEESKTADDIKNKFYSKILVMENMFRSQELDDLLEKDIHQDIVEECETHKIDDLVKVSFFKKDQVVTAKFRSAELVEKLIQKFDKRYYDGLILNVHVFTGVKYN